jgi:hypothetical protein
MIFTEIYLMCAIYGFTYQLGTTLGAPDTIKLLQSPLKVVEKGDTIIVLDQDKERRVIKNYTLDGFFISMRQYEVGRDSLLFEPSWVEPEVKIKEQAFALFDEEFNFKDINENWKAMHIDNNNNVWLVGSWYAGDAGGLNFLSFNLKNSRVKAFGHGPILSYYRKNSIRSHFLKLYKTPFYFHVGHHYIYLITSEFLWQYDRKGRLVRKVGIQSEYSFKEPCGITIGLHNSVFISDFRLGYIWKYNPNIKPSFRTIRASKEILPESITFITTKEKGSLWFSDVLHRKVQNIGSYSEITRSFSINELHYGGGEFSIALSNSLIFLYEIAHHQVVVYDTLGHYIKTIRGRNYKKDRVIGMDNYGNCYFFKVDRQFSDLRFFRISPIDIDTFHIILPDTFQSYRLEWQKSYRVKETLYVLGIYKPYLGDNDFGKVHGFFIFVNDTLSRIIDETEFECQLPEHISDFVVNRHGRIWVVDIENRLVQEYIPSNYDKEEYEKK